MRKMLIIGRLGKDCQVNNVNGKTVINFSVAVSEKVRGQETTAWIECAYWTENTGISPYLLKGTQVYVEGKPEVEAYKKNDGEAAAKQRLFVYSVQLLGKAQGDQAAATQGQTAPASQTGGGSYDDLPF